MSFIVLLGIFASLASLMFNCVKKDDIDYSPYEEGEWRLANSVFILSIVCCFFLVDFPLSDESAFPESDYALLSLNSAKVVIFFPIIGKFRQLLRVLLFLGDSVVSCDIFCSFS